MNIQYNKQKLETALADIYTLTKTPISIFDKNFNFVITSREGNMTDFCNIIRSTETGKKACFLSDENGCAKCKTLGKSFSYVCHAFVEETVTPIFFENEIVGYIIFGQYKTSDQREKILLYAEEKGLNKDALLSAYDNLTVLTERQINAVCNILKNCILGFYLIDAVSVSPETLPDRIADFINVNLNKKLTAEVLCEHFLINKKQLYGHIKDAFNCSLKDFITAKRIELAKKLLVTTDFSVARICEKCGFSDYNNFIQRFKKEVGLTPLRFKKSNQ